MATIELTSFNKFLEQVSKYHQKTTIYRGVTHEKYDLRPKIGRVTSTKKTDTLLALEKRILRRFSERAIPFIDYKPEYEFEWMVLAQHHGAPTRLLDWTRNPLVAAYFAVQRPIHDYEIDKETSGNSAIYVYKSNKTLISRGNVGRANSAYVEGPFKVKDVRKFIPAHIDRRIVAQSAVFTVHPDPEQKNPFKEKELDKLILPGEKRKAWKKGLFSLGVNIASLFPDIDHTVIQIEWELTKCH